MSATAPTAYALQKVVSAAMQTLEMLRTEHGQVIDTPDEVIAALSEEGVDVATILRRLARATLDAKANAAAAEARMEDLQARRDRFKRWEATYRGVILDVMEAILPRDKDGKMKFADPEFSLSVSAGQPRVIITDEATVPEAYVTVTETKAVNKTQIKYALQLGEDVPGASLSNGGSVLTVRSK